MPLESAVCVKTEARSAEMRGRSWKRLLISYDIRNVIQPAPMECFVPFVKWKRNYA